MKQFIAIILLVILQTRRCLSDDLCVSVRHDEPIKSPRTHIQGRPGKIGPPGASGINGSPGRRGLRGLPGRCSCDMHNLEREVQRLKETVENLKNVVRSSNSRLCSDGLVYEDQCIRFLYNESLASSFNKAQEICSSINSELAEITSDDMYDHVYKYVNRTNWRSQFNWSWVSLWLGSTYQTNRNTNNFITLTNGRKIKLAKWYPGYPRSISNRRNLIMQIRRDSQNTGQGIWNACGTCSGINAFPLCSQKIV